MIKANHKYVYLILEGGMSVMYCRNPSRHYIRFGYIRLGEHEKDVRQELTIIFRLNNMIERQEPQLAIRAYLGV